MWKCQERNDNYMPKALDLTGQKYGKLTVIKRSLPRRTSGGHSKTMWLCECGCGNFTEVSTISLRNGNTKSCGCYRKESESKADYSDLTGERFGRLTVIERKGSVKKRALWLCQCDCGNTTLVTTNSLKTGNTQSCGCYRLERDVEVNTTHGGTGTRLYNIWNGIKSRCSNPNDTCYQHYGARGITVCDEWKNDFSSFRKWALENGYADNLTIERKDVNGNYEPNNCCWITLVQQGYNKTNSVLITRNGETKTMTEWARIFGIPYKTISYRLKAGWSEEHLFDPPKNKEN